MADHHRPHHNHPHHHPLQPSNNSLIRRSSSSPRSSGPRSSPGNVRETPKRSDRSTTTTTTTTTSSSRRQQQQTQQHLPDGWEEDQSAIQCRQCNKVFSFINRRHHCRNCGLIYCADCTGNRIVIKDRYHHDPVRVCEQCYFSLRRAQRDNGGRSESQLYSQLRAMEDVSKALLVENRDMRSRIDNLEAIVAQQTKVIEILRHREGESEQLIARLNRQHELDERALVESERVKLELDRALRTIRRLSGNLPPPSPSGGPSEPPPPPPRHSIHHKGGRGSHQNGVVSPLSSSPPLNGHTPASPSSGSAGPLPIPMAWTSAPQTTHPSTSSSSTTAALVAAALQSTAASRGRRHHHHHHHHPFGRRGRSVSSSEAELSSAGSSYDEAANIHQNLAALSTSPSFHIPTK